MAPPPPPQPPSPSPSPEDNRWSALPPELLQEISLHLLSILDFIRFRSVCRSWRSAAAPSLLPPQLPLLILPYDPSSTSRPFHRPPSPSLDLVLRLPEARGHRVCGSAYGWLVLVEEDVTNLTLLNPFTGSLIPLPPSPVPGRMVARAVLSARPTAPAGCTVVVSVIYSSELNFCRILPGGGCFTGWSTVQTGLDYYANSIAYHHGKLCVVQGPGEVSVIDISLLTDPPTISRPELPYRGDGWILEYNNLVESSTGELLLVAIYLRYDDPDPSTYHRDDFVVYRLELDESREPSWVVLESIGDMIIFLSDHHAVSVTLAGEFLGCREYFLYRVHYEVGDGVIDATAFVLGSKSSNVEEQPSFFRDYSPSSEVEANWLVPCLI